MSYLEDTFSFQCKFYRLPQPECQYKFCERRWKFDFAWPDKKIAIEIDGGIWSGGRHVRGKGFEMDCEKLNKAVSLGWKVYRFSGSMVNDGRAILFIQDILNSQELT